MKKRALFGGYAGNCAIVLVAAAAVMVQPEDSVATPGSSSGAHYQPEACPHAPGAFLVGYVSEDAFLTAPRENVVDTFDWILMQHLAHPEEIQNDPDHSSRFTAEEATRQKLLAQPSISYIECNCTKSISNACPPTGS